MALGWQQPSCRMSEYGYGHIPKPAPPSAHIARYSTVPSTLPQLVHLIRTSKCGFGIRALSTLELTKYAFHITTMTTIDEDYIVYLKGTDVSSFLGSPAMLLDLEHRSTSNGISTISGIDGALI